MITDQSPPFLTVLNDAVNRKGKLSYYVDLRNC